MAADVEEGTGEGLVGRDLVLGVVDDVLGRRPGPALVVAGAWGCGRTAVLAEVARRGARLRHEVVSLTGARPLQGERFAVLAPHVDVTSIETARVGLVERAAAARRPLLVVADDAHLLDGATAAVLALLAGRGEATVVASVPLPQRVDWLEHLADARRGLVEPLAPDDALLAVQRWSGGALDGRAARSLVADTGGRPALLRAAVDGARQADRLVAVGPALWRLVGTTWIGEPLAAIVHERLGRLDQASRVALELVCVAGRLAHADLVTAVGPDVADGLERDGLVEVRHDGPALQVEATPAVLAQVVRRDLPAGARAARSRQAADAVAAGGAGTGVEAGRLARLRLDAGEPASAGTALAAARLARGEGDLDEAERLAHLASNDDEHADSVLELASILHERGKAASSEAALVAVRCDGERDRVLVALARANNLEWSLHRPSHAIELLAATEAAVVDDQLRVELAAARAGVVHLSGRSAEAAAELEALLARARTPRARQRVLNNLASACAFTGAVERVRTCVAQVGALGVELADEPALPDPGFLFLSLAFATGEAGLLDEADAVATLGYDGATAVDESAGMGWFALVRGRIAVHRGRFADADRWFAEARWRLGVLDLHGPVAWARAGECLAAVGRGRRVAAPVRTDGADPLAFGLHQPDLARAAGWAAAGRGEPVAAVAHFVGAAEQAAATGAAPQEVQAWLDLVRVSAHRSEVAPAAARLEELASSLATPVAAAAARFAEGAAGDRAPVLEHAAAAFEHQGMVVVAAEAWARAAGSYQRRRDRRAEARAAAEVARLTRPDWATPGLGRHDAPAALTPRELQVARLAASGMRTDAIADELGVAFRTVENHLHRAYGKLGVGGKHELAGVLSP